MAAMSRCNYALAFFDEVLRCSSVADFTFFHRPTKPVVHFRGHVITDDKLVMGNLWACHNDPDVWGEPQKFRPERFVPSHECCLRRGENSALVWVPTYFFGLHSIFKTLSLLVIGC